MLIGRPLARERAEDERLPNIEALPILSSDALSSVAYATEASLGVLILAGSSSLQLSLPITLAIVILIAIVVLSYRQAIDAYPNGGGSYVVARDNLGVNVGLIAAAALLIDYTLTAAVSLMAGMQALSSMLPALVPHETSCALLLLALVGWANLRGLREAGRVFAVPTYLFVVMLALLTAAGMADLLFSHGFTPDPPAVVQPLQPLGWFLILRAFSSGCSAMTGIESIANGVKVFREPAPRNARRTLVVMGAMLSLMVMSVSGLAYVYGIVPNAQITVLAQIGNRVFGAGSPLLWVLQLSTLLILTLAANTAFTGFPRLAAMLADDSFLPKQMSWVGDRLVFQNGIGVLLAVTALIIVICQGDTTVAVNLYALGVFTAFTLSQTGLVRRWWRLRSPGWQGRLAMNAAGALTTFAVLIVIVVSKFAEGAWTVVVAIPLLVAGLASVLRRYRSVYRAITPGPSQAPRLLQPSPHGLNHHSIVWVSALLQPALDALDYACRVSNSVTAVHVLRDGEEAQTVQAQWSRLVADAGSHQVDLICLDSPFSSLVAPFSAFVAEQELQRPDQAITVVMPVVVPRDWFDALLLNQGAINLFQALAARHNHNFAVVRYYVERPPAALKRRMGD